MNADNNKNMVIGNNLVYEYIRNNNSGEVITQEKFRALNKIDITIEKGDFVAILGHNGSGKSTLAKHLNALLLPTEGTLLIKGFDTKDEKNIWNVRQSAGMVFQNPDNQLIATIVEEDIAFGPENLGIPSEEIYERVAESLAAVNMSEFKKSSPHLLSGGQKQRIAIAGILAMKPECIILDEPTAMLDPVGRKEVMETITRLNKEENITIILITHYMEEAVKANRVIVMEKGNVVMDDIPRAVFKQVEKLKQLGLDVPQVTELAHHLEKRGIGLRSDIIDIDEMVDAICQVKNTGSTTGLPSQNIQSESHDLQVKPLISIKNVSHIYSVGTTFQKVAVENINIEINEGEFIGLIGHTGSGKSTLIQHLNALYAPTSGEILMNGENINADKSKLKAIRQKVGLVFQYPEHQLFEMTVFKDVAFGPKNMGLSESEVNERVREALAIVGISEEIFEKSPFELSGGQKRRVAIAGVIAMRPQVLVLDEPTAGLDPKGRDEILDQIKKMHEKLNITVILVSHSMEDIAKLVSRILVMHKGKLAFDGTPKSVFQQVEDLEKMGLAAPQISYLMRGLNEKGFSFPVDLYTVADATNVLYEFLK